MIQTKEELFLAELGVNTKEEIELAYGAKIKITDLLKKYEKQLTLTDVSQQRELLITVLKDLDLGYIQGFNDEEWLADKVIEVINCG
jgi:hypothetical protein